MNAVVIGFNSEAMDTFTAKASFNGMWKTRKEHKTCITKVFRCVVRV